MKALEVKNICKNFGGLKVLQNVSISVETGERRAIIGPNGAGKTTLFNIISGITTASSGEIFIFGKKVTTLSPYHRARLGLGRTFQKNNLFSDLSLLENIYLAMRINKSPLNMQDFLQQWGMWNRRNIKVKKLSYGEQRQVELLLALAQAPKILLLDEPTAGMSPVEKGLILQMIKGLDRSITILIIEHDMEVVFNLADRITVLHLGQVLCEATPEIVKANPRVQEIYLGTTGEEVWH